MSKILKDFQLKPFNTFGIEAKAAFFVEVNSLEELLSVLKNDDLRAEKKLFLGGGSNILLTKDFEGIVIKLNLKGLDIIKKTAKNTIIKAGAGENWHGFVQHCIALNLAGVENLSLIPGTCGAAPMQNIGAYGVEIKDVFESLEALNLETLAVETFDLATCRFGYRESIFKHEAKGKYVILNVSFKLNNEPNINIEYGAIKDTLAEMGIQNPSIQDVSKAVIAIRQSKLPNPAEIGNAGSFFKNPEISKTQFDVLKIAFPTMPGYVVSDTIMKVPAGWLIEQAGWKGQRFGEVGVHAKQALVLVNYGDGKGKEIKDLSKKIQDSIQSKFGIGLNVEVNFI
jgi:UDP-N-acetylmuramate dehydrogenase